MNNFKGDVCVTVNSHYLAKNNTITYLLAPDNLNSLRKKKANFWIKILWKRVIFCALQFFKIFISFVTFATLFILVFFNINLFILIGG